MKLPMLAVVLLGLFFPAAQAAAFQYSRPVEHPPSAQEEFVAVDLDSPLYFHTRDRFKDLRLIDAEKTETPYLIVKLRSERSKAVRKWHQPRIVALEQAEPHAIEIQLRLTSDDPPADGLSLQTSLVNFEHRVQVFGSMDGARWSGLVENALIYDYSKFIDLDNREIPLPANRYRWLKVRVEEPVQTYESENIEITRELWQGRERGRSETTQIRRAPLRIDRIKYWSREVQSRPAVARLDYPLAAFGASQDEATRSTIIDITTRREPLTGFIVETTQRNFSRRAVVEAAQAEQGDPGRWRPIGDATLERINFRALHREHLQIRFPEQRHREYRIVIQNDDNPSLEITGVKARGNGYRLLFFAEPGKTYVLEYGDDSAQPPVYDTASLQAALAASYQPVRIALGPEAAGRTAGQAGFDFDRWLNSDLFLGGVIFIMVTILAGALLYAGKRIDQSPGE